MLSSSTPPTPPSPPRPPSFRASDRLVGRVQRLVRRVVFARPYLAAAIALHAVLAGVLLRTPGFGATEHARSDATRAAQLDRRVERTALRGLQRRVARLEEIRDELAGAPGAASAPAPALPVEPPALAARARLAFGAIVAWERQTRSATLARLAELPLAEARRQVDAEEDAAEAPVPRDEAPADTIVRLERRAESTLAGRDAQRATRRDGLRVSGVARAAAPASRARAVAAAASGAIGSEGGIPRSMAEQLAALARLGPAQGRVGVTGTAAGRSLNPEHVKGVAGGHVAVTGDADRDGPLGGARDLGPPVRARDIAPVTLRGGTLDLAQARPDGGHALVRGVAGGNAPAIVAHTAAGRAFGAGGTFAQRVYLDSWYVVGPFAGHGDGTIDTVYPPEEDVDLDGAWPGLDGRTLTWRFVSRGFYPFIPPDRADGGVYYAWTELRVDEDVDAWFAIAADDDSKLWVDDRLVWIGEHGDKPWYHPPYYRRDELIGSLGLVEGRRRVHLDPGVHRLLFKLVNERDLTFFSVVVSR